MGLKHLKNLGPVSVKILEGAGIETQGQLRQLGVVETYLRVRECQSGVTLNMLYALHGALTDTHWRRIGADARASLLIEVDARDALPNDDLYRQVKGILRRVSSRGKR
jgi:DNA transformation protein